MPLDKLVVKTFEDIKLMPGSSLVRDRVDPHHTLPEVSLNIFEKEDWPGNFCREKIDIIQGEEAIGWCDLITEHDKQTMHFDLITLDATRKQNYDMNEAPRRERPKGLGLASYLVAIETAHKRGLPFESQDGSLSAGSNRIWEILVERAVAVVLEPPQKYMRGDKEKVIAKYMAPILAPIIN